MAELQTPLRRSLRDPVDERAVERMWQRISARRSAANLARLPRYRVGRWAGAFAMASAMMVVGWLGVRYYESLRPKPSVSTLGPLKRMDGPVLAQVSLSGENSKNTTIALVDGSRLIVEPATFAQTQENTGRSVKLRIDHGTVTFDIKPHGPRQWTIRCDVANIVVIGTRFTVSKNTAGCSVHVEHGIVEVHASEQRTRLVAGQSFVTSIAANPRDTSRTEEGRTIDAGLTSPVITRPSWREHARERDFDRAYEILGQEGLERETNRADSAEELWMLADVARLSGHVVDAVAPLERLVQEYPNDGRGALAAFTLGKVQMDALGYFAAAARSFARAVELRPPRGLLEDAYARLAEAHMRSGNTQGARATAEVYEQWFPEGRYLEQMRALRGAVE